MVGGPLLDRPGAAAPPTEALQALIREGVPPQAYLCLTDPDAPPNQHAMTTVGEGVGIATPLVEVRPAPRVFAGLAALAGLPAVLGTWAGAFAFLPRRISILRSAGPNYK